jgi:hypothetical protein
VIVRDGAASWPGPLSISLLRRETDGADDQRGEPHVYDGEQTMSNLAALRGKLAGSKESDAWSQDRGQYIKVIVGID